MEKMVYTLSRMRLVANSNSMRLVANSDSSFHSLRRSSNLWFPSVSNLFYKSRFSGGFRCLSTSPLLKDNNVASSNNRYSDWDLRSSPPIPFDICQGPNVLTSSEEVSATHQPGGLRYLRPGMVLLKQYLSQHEQVSIVRECRRLGVGPGGFYWPQMRLMLMCLGLDWDPHTRKYNKRRQFDKVLVPDIPHELIAMVKRAVNDGRALTDKKHRGGNVKDILPMMSPDICIVNFYTAQGRLGLHQDRDESRGSLVKGLPIVSFSLGNSAEFLYGDVRDTNKAKKAVLESGDVVIFGGPSRHVFHGVQSIIPHTAPDFLLKETNLLPGRLNLTFRQY